MITSAARAKARNSVRSAPVVTTVVMSPVLQCTIKVAMPTVNEPTKANQIVSLYSFISLRPSDSLKPSGSGSWPLPVGAYVRIQGDATQGVKVRALPAVGAQ